MHEQGDISFRLAKLVPQSGSQPLEYLSLEDHHSLSPRFLTIVEGDIGAGNEFSLDMMAQSLSMIVCVFSIIYCFTLNSHNSHAHRH